MSDDNELSLGDQIDQAEFRVAKDQAAANAVASRAADIIIFAEQSGVSADAVAAALYEEARDEAGEGLVVSSRKGVLRSQPICLVT